MRCRPVLLRGAIVTEPLNIALLGCGNVGAAVATLLQRHPNRFADRAGRALVLRRVVVRDLTKRRAFAVSPALLTTELDDVLNDAGIDVVVELVGGVSWAREAVLRSLAAGKDVVTANKALLAEHGTEVFQTARRYHRSVAFEASVCGGIPIVAALTQGMAANQIVALQGILNGTSNSVLTDMTDSGRSYACALAEAQQQGYAEADSTLDVDGTDAAHKLDILARLAFGVDAAVDSIPRRGIANLDAMDIRFARELGYTIKLLAEAWLESASGRLALHVSPVLLRHTMPLAQVRGPYNAILVVGDVVGDTLYYGRGAGPMPTASAVVADLIDIAVGKAPRTFHSLKLWSSNPIGVTRMPPGDVRTRFYLRLLVADRPGVLADVARILAKHHISISSVIQHEAPEDHEGDTVALVIMTHAAHSGDFASSVVEMNRGNGIAAPAVYYPVAD